MTIAIHDAALEASIKKRLEATGSSTLEEVLRQLLDAQDEQDRWLAEMKDAHNEKIRRGLKELDNGEGIPEDRVQGYLNRLKQPLE